ncbi:MAG TPA: xanthine dehydrogenase family protein molybdopterin-binding subunit, partial [Candidatus Binatia bacterium]
TAVVGQRVMPAYGIAKATGTAKFAPDVNPPNVLWMKILRSPHPHARILQVDTAPAQAMPGVAAVLTYGDVPRVLFGPYENELYPLDQEVRFVGDAVAAVAAEDWNIAEEAARAIRIQYEPLPAIFDTEAAAQPGATIAVLDLPDPDSTSPWWQDHAKPTFRNQTTNVYSEAPGAPTVMNRRGNVERGFQESDYVVERVFRQPHMNGVAHEPRACVAVWENDRCTLWCSVQEPYKLANAVARVLDIPETSVRVVATILGGGFGVKVAGRFAILCALMARKTGRPVKIWFTREEESMDSHNRPALVHYVKAGAKTDGTLTAFKIRTYLNNGYWLGKSTSRLAHGMVNHIMDLYHVCPNVLWETFVTRTNLPSAGPFRGRSDAESHFAVDTVVDELAHAVDMDPLEFRLKNRIREGDDLCSSPGRVISSVGVEEAVRQGAQAIGWAGRQRVPGSAPGPRKKGIGMAMVIHSAGGQPFRGAAARIEIDDRGGIGLFSGTSDQGSEQQTTLRQMAAEVLGISQEDIGGTNADTAICPRDTGPISSRTVYSTGIATVRAAGDTRRQLLEQASKSLEVAVEDLELGHQRVWVKGSPARAVSWAELAGASGGLIVAQGRFNAHEGHSIPSGFAATFAEVEVDVESGEVKILRLVSSHDVGRAINPTIVEGQIQGGAAQGLGYALTEGFHFDARTGTALNQWFLDLRTPSILDTPDIEPIMVELPEPTHPFGAKGCSEISTVGVAPAVANAVFNATGLRLRELPMTPERVLAAWQHARGASR